MLVDIKTPIKMNAPIGGNVLPIRRIVKDLLVPAMEQLAIAKPQVPKPRRKGRGKQYIKFL